MKKKRLCANSDFIGRPVLIPGLSSIDLTGKLKSKVWLCGGVALGKVLPEFVYFAVKICQRATLPSATLNFLAGKNFANRPKHQAWVGQADFRKVELIGITAVTVNACQ